MCDRSMRKVPSDLHIGGTAGPGEGNAALWPRTWNIIMSGKMTVDRLSSLSRISWRRIPEDVPRSLRENIQTLLRNERPNVLFESFENMCKSLASRTEENAARFVKNKDEPFLAPGLHETDGRDTLKPFAYTPTYTKAYLGFRMLSSYAVVRRLLRECANANPEFQPTSMLDFGAGPGTALWAAHDVWPGHIRECVNIEPSESMVQAGNYLLRDAETAYANVSWHSTITDPSLKHTQYSLVVAANVMGELPSDRARAAALQIMWNHVDPDGGQLLLIEPGTKWGFRTIATARAVLADPANDGVRLEAPCTHAMACPMTSKETNPRGISCQFPQRTPMPVIDSSNQKRKSRHSFPPVTKFCYLRASANEGVSDETRTADETDEAYERIISPPLHRNKHVILDVCNSSGALQRRVYSKGKMKVYPGAYRVARKSEYGGLWVDPTQEEVEAAREASRKRRRHRRSESGNGRVPS